MAFEIRFAPEAEEDLFAIYTFVADAAGFGIADAYDARLRAACLRLTDFPNRGTPHDELAPGLRSVAFERRASIYYRVTGPRVEILRILHAGRDAKRSFEGG